MYYISINYFTCYMYNILQDLGAQVAYSTHNLSVCRNRVVDITFKNCITITINAHSCSSIVMSDGWYTRCSHRLTSNRRIQQIGHILPSFLPSDNTTILQLYSFLQLGNNPAVQQVLHIWYLLSGHSIIRQYYNSTIFTNKKQSCNPTNQHNPIINIASSSVIR